LSAEREEGIWFTGMKKQLIRLLRNKGRKVRRNKKREVGGGTRDSNWIILMEKEEEEKHPPYATNRQTERMGRGRGRHLEGSWH